MREIRAGDEQHEAGEADQHEEHALGILGHDSVVERNGAPRAGGIGGGEVRGEAAAEVGDESGGLGAGEIARATADEPQPRGGAFDALLVVEREGPVEVEQAHRVAPVEKAGGQNADYLVGLAIDAHRAANDVGPAAEAVLPITVTNQEDPVVAREVFLGAKVAAELRLDAEDGEKIGRNPEATGHLGGQTGLGEAHFLRDVGGNLAVTSPLRLEGEIVGRRDEALRLVGGGAIDAVQLIAVDKGQRSQHVAVEDAEHRGVGPDAERERHHGHGGKAGRLGELPKSEANVGEHGSESESESESERD